MRNAATITRYRWVRPDGDCETDGHVMLYAGRGAGVRDGSACTRPIRFQCQRCQFERFKNCDATRPSRCVRCASNHPKYVSAIARSGATDCPSGLMFITLTARGAEHLPWDTSKCLHDASGRDCAGGKGCVVVQDLVAADNASAPQRWSWFVEYLRREVGGFQFFKVWETQDRGALHVHALVRLDHPRSRRQFYQDVKTCALQWGFGRQVDVQSLGTDMLEVARKAGYCASYVAPTSELPAHSYVREVDPVSGKSVVVHHGYRPWSASQHYGDKMKDVRGRQIAFMRAGGHREAGLLGAVGGSVADGGTDGSSGEAALDLKTDIYTTDFTGWPFQSLDGVISSV